MAVYLLCFSRPLSHARHYLGFADTVESIPARIIRHQKGDGAKLTKAAVREGIEFELTRVWPEGTREFERQLKNGKRGPRLCPKCLKGKNEAINKDSEEPK